MGVPDPVNAFQCVLWIIGVSMITFFESSYYLLLYMYDFFCLHYHGLAPLSTFQEFSDLISGCEYDVDVMHEVTVS